MTRKETALRTYTLPFRLFHLTLVICPCLRWLPPKASMVLDAPKPEAEIYCGKVSLLITGGRMPRV